MKLKVGHIVRVRFFGGPYAIVELRKYIPKLDGFCFRYIDNNTWPKNGWALRTQLELLE